MVTPGCYLNALVYFKFLGSIWICCDGGWRHVADDYYCGILFLYPAYKLLE